MLVTAGYDGEGSDITIRSMTRRPKSVTFEKEPPDVLHYEMVTPEPSIDGSTVHYDSDEDDDDYEDELENTPVIEPDEWSRMMAQDAAGNPHDDNFRSTPSPSSRPLPPIPGPPRGDSNSPPGGRPLPSLPVTKADLQNLQKMPLEERLRMMMQYEEYIDRDHSSRRASSEATEEMDDDEGHHGHAIESMTFDDKDSESQYGERRESMSSAQLDDSTSESNAPSSNSMRETDTEDSSVSQYESTSEYEPPRLSRESIRRQVEARREASYEPTPEIDDNGLHGADGEHHQYIQEVDSQVDDAQIKEEPSDDERSIDLYAVPEMSKVHERPASRFDTRSPDSDRITESEVSNYDHNDDESQYSDYQDSTHDELPDREDSTPTPTNLGELTIAPPKREVEDCEPQKVALGATQDEARMSLPDISLFDGEGLGLNDYMTPSPPLQPVASPKEEAAPSSSIARDFLSENQETPEEESEPEIDDDEDTGSVIRHKIYHSSDEEEEADDEDENSIGESDIDAYNARDERDRSPSPVAESVATIRAPGGKLKTRASSTPADIAQMAAARRHVSGDLSRIPPVPRIPDDYRSDEAHSDDNVDEEGSDDEDTIGAHSDGEGVERKESVKRKSIDLPALGEFEFDLKLDDLSEEFDRVIEAQKVNSKNSH
jgi:hypothetical protein